ncbi:MAG: histidine kinase, partial [Gammaproteobacteria bacterium]|nr:histidine kinase [Gammaproteobacteria bacterium]
SGDGMGPEDIENCWLVLGRSRKNRTQQTRLGRIPTGDKGLGRLAALRMGTLTHLETVWKKRPHEKYFLTIDWRVYDDTENVEEIALEIVTKTYPVPQSEGTTITIESLHSCIEQIAVKRLARELLLLADPFDDNAAGFRPVLKAPEFKELEQLVQNRYFNEAEFCLSARVDHEGFARATVTDWKGQTLFSATHENLRPGKGGYRSPRAEFHLWIFLLDKATFTNRGSTVTLSEIRSWLRAFGGIHLYYNGLRVPPYGDEGNDWLDVNLKRATDPYLKPTTNTIIGRVMVTDTSNALQQATNRADFIQNEAFSELKEFARDALQWLARRRRDEADKRRAVQRKEAAGKTEAAKIEFRTAIAELPGTERLKMETIFNRYVRTSEQEADRLKKEVQLYRTLSTAGITTAVFAHESTGNPVKVIALTIKSVQTRAQKYLGDNYQKILEKPIALIMRSVKSLGILGKVALSLVEHEKRRIGRVDVHPLIQEVIELFEPFAQTRQTRIITEFDPGNPYLRGSVAAMESIITNLFNNSLQAFERKEPGERVILVRTIVNTGMEIHILDNGPGIMDIDKKDIWLPGQSTRPNGTGLGLTIVRDAVYDLGGSVEALEKSELGGAEIIIRLPMLGV